MPKEPLMTQWCGTGDFAYPGHPLVIATMVMSLYPSLAAANEVTGSGFSQALGDQRIPGAGCHVNAGLTVLQRVAAGASCDEAIAFARHYWEDGKAGGHPANVDAGLGQAQRVEPFFRQMLAAWDFAPARTNCTSEGA